LNNLNIRFDYLGQLFLKYIENLGPGDFPAAPKKHLAMRKVLDIAGAGDGN
jgi:hypothetical protein